MGLARHHDQEPAEGTKGCLGLDRVAPRTGFPAQPTCTFTVTSMSTSGTVTGAVGQGDWVVVVKRKKVPSAVIVSCAQRHQLLKRKAASYSLPSVNRTIKCRQVACHDFCVFQMYVY